MVERLDFIELNLIDGVTTIVLNNGKVNALNTIVVDNLMECLKELEGDEKTQSLILTGHDKFFSFGFDIPHFLSFSKEQFTEYLIDFTNLYKYIFAYPKPVIAALNGHTIAGGCMLALACDHRIMVEGRGKISLNEIGFGSSVFAGSTEMLRFWIGSANATRVLYSGDMYSATEALDLGLVHEIASRTNLPIQAQKKASELGSKPAAAFSSIKSLLRKATVEQMKNEELRSIRELVDIWYSEKTWANLQKIKIHG